MKKRKKPIFLAAIAILLVVSVMAFNMAAYSSSQSPDLNAGQLTPEQQAEKQKLDKDQKKQADADAAKAAAAKNANDDLGVMIHPKGADALGDQPKIMAPKQMKEKKVDPSDGSVNSQAQWYTKQSGAG